MYCSNCREDQKKGFRFDYRKRNTESLYKIKSKKVFMLLKFFYTEFCSAAVQWLKLIEHRIKNSFWRCGLGSHGLIEIAIQSIGTFCWMLEYETQEIIIFLLFWHMNKFQNSIWALFAYDVIVSIVAIIINCSKFWKLL